MNDVITLLLGGGLAASIIEIVKFVATRQQVKRKDEAASNNENASAQATIGGAWRELWQTNEQWSRELEKLVKHEREKSEKLVDLVQKAARLLPSDQADPILDEMHVIRSS
ncbi:hypothetical protein PBI_WOES_39 [Gordonia phage Woes]|uniref:Uncharacterized protein n=13 Tax=Woesvirus woes TaxID=1982751 RepID=A0A482JGV5_9CAUD|nr:hypothetical protein BH793_gp74 [Gordonia phage Woes]ATW61134.1 hypothetical protein SEA_ANAMIKA_39 [Gordonia phage Anamika]AVP43224.1 hypothetical protein PBI_HAIL2PITT_39 [Gordonia phage Hail2Pitt]QAX94323.1 hypothetical protein SEA_GUILLAUME_39 [Gordonia phage Guillaume]QAX94645.1 hypothetical protein SEA_HARAMBE_39 [Gordonia phage Harambe]QAX95308.1 hypothetical protein SEA_HELLO_39 [Gordonia phage Hello]QAX95400.1 hypothetical protein SEA_NEOEVIE_39 [Gordonia phage Neoevie]QBP30317.1